MTAQLELIPAKKARVTPRDIAWFCTQLRDADGWRTSTDLGAKTEKEKRWLRQVAEKSDGAIVSYPGSPGYKLFDKCLPEDFRHGRNATISQTKKMAAKWNRVERRMHANRLVDRPQEIIVS